MSELIYFCDEKRHLVCYPYSLHNLHRMAKDLEISFSWFHKNHYDIPKKRIEEIKAKCTVVNSRAIVTIIASGHIPPFLDADKEKFYADKRLKTKVVGSN